VEAQPGRGNSVAGPGRGLPLKKRKRLANSCIFDKANYKPLRLNFYFKERL